MAGGSEEVRLTLRMPADLRDRITNHAARSGRSLNAEIVQQLEAYENGGDVAEEWKRRFEEEHKAFRRMQQLYESSLDVALGYRDVLGNVKTTLRQYVAMLKTLAGSVSELDHIPSADFIAIADRMKQMATDMQEKLEKEADLEKARDELKSVNQAIAKADDLLNKAKRD
jgi:hypothetical protein